MTENTSEYRIEHDTMGEVRVPADALYSAQTQRAVQNFPISGKTLERQHIRALAQVKKAAAKANQELGVLDAQRAEAIRSAADRVAAGEFDDQFPIDVFQTGSGTSSNMNTNEVLATLATRALKEAGCRHNHSLPPSIPHDPFSRASCRRCGAGSRSRCARAARRSTRPACGAWGGTCLCLGVEWLREVSNRVVWTLE